MYRRGSDKSSTFTVFGPPRRAGGLRSVAPVVISHQVTGVDSVADSCELKQAEGTDDEEKLKHGSVSFLKNFSLIIVLCN
jgi:hypothetical protein